MSAASPQRGECEGGAAPPLHQSPTVGGLLREWRARRRLSQLELALEADVSTRHLSFVETGRSQPSRDMVVRLSEQLEIPLRERNHLLLAAGYAPAYPESDLEEDQRIRDAVRSVLKAYEPFPATAVDRHWELVEANASIATFLDGVHPDQLQPPVNALRLALHPQGLAPHIENLGEWRAHLLARLRRQVAATHDPQLASLYAELKAYPCDDEEPEIEVPGPGEIVVPLKYKGLTFMSIVTTFGTPLDVTLQELSIEAFLPADEHTAKALQASR